MGYYESGTANGISACWAAVQDRHIEIHTFDPINRVKIWDYDNTDLSDLTPNIHFHQERFSDGLERVYTPNQKSIFFLDGDHSGEGVKEDWEAVEKVMSPGDTVIFHDLNIEAIHRFWLRRVMPKYNCETLATRRIMAVVHIA
jgi:predicted O-methyltransferase YrrM